MIFWILFSILMVSLAWGLLTLPAVYSRLDAGPDDDLDRLAHESW